jgi:CopG family nickel-responsive transcriptional regulator
MNDSNIDRISISINQGLLGDFNHYVAEHGYENRSAAISHLIRQELLQSRGDQNDEVLAGSITLFYNEGRSNLPTEIASLQRLYIDQVISSLHVLLEEGSVMEVLVVQGPLWKLKEMAAKFVSLRGVETGKLTLTSAILPPVYGKVQAHSEIERSTK